MCCNGQPTSTIKREEKKPNLCSLRPLCSLQKKRKTPVLCTMFGCCLFSLYLLEFCSASKLWSHKICNDTILFRFLVFVSPFFLRSFLFHCFTIHFFCLFFSLISLKKCSLVFFAILFVVWFWRDVYIDIHKHKVLFRLNTTCLADNAIRDRVNQFWRSVSWSQNIKYPDWISRINQKTGASMKYKIDFRFVQAKPHKKSKLILC